MIDDRTEEINERVIPGLWEDDVILGKKQPVSSDYAGRKGQPIRGAWPPT
ncbi:hypothetical protein [Corynebacterium ulcerans]|nr:hypothetical protein [Corynebacterium ulcerans]